MNNQSGLQRYLGRTFRVILIVAPIVSLVASATFLLGKIVGWFPTVSWTALIVFCCLNVPYLAVGLFFLQYSYDENGDLRPHCLTAGKYVFGFLLLVQWNFISYMIPSQDFWAFLPLFLLLAAVLLDLNFVLIESALLLASIGLSWILRPGILLPAYDPDAPWLFASSVTLRLVCLFLSVFAIAFVTNMCSTVLLREMETVSDVDPLTRLYNRRPLDGMLEKAQQEVVRGKQYSLAVFDIDDFKRVNDTYGHTYGDKVLRAMAKLLAEETAKDGVAFRWGGEEFLLLLPCDKETAFAACDRVREAFGNIVFSPMADVELHVTVTAGVASLFFDRPYKQTLSEADGCLYEGKRMGKNRVVVAP